MAVMERENGWRGRERGREGGAERTREKKRERRRCRTEWKHIEQSRKKTERGREG